MKQNKIYMNIDIKINKRLKSNHIVFSTTSTSTFIINNKQEKKKFK